MVQPAWAAELKGEIYTAEPALEVVSGNEKVHLIELVGECRAKKTKWWKFGKKYYVYKCKESNMTYLTPNKLPKVLDRRSFAQRHPIRNGLWKTAEVTWAGTLTAIGAILAGSR